MTFTLDDILSAAGAVQREMQADATLVPHLYVDKGWSIARIAQHTGLHRSTVYRRLEASGDYRGPGKPGAPRKTHCKRGHDLSVHGRERKSGGRECSECKRISQRRGP